MVAALLAPLGAWQNYYVIIGTAAATLTGLMFIVITLLVQLGVRPTSPASGMRIFNTSNLVHFGAALLIAALLNVPWPTLWVAVWPLGLTGLAGVGYVLLVLWEVRRLKGYQLVLSDWLCYAFIPLIFYIALFVAALLLPIYPELALFIIAGVTLLLLFIGIRNAWDMVTYMAIERANPQDSNQC